MSEKIKEAEYWRDMCTSLLGWGIATCFIVIGWSMTEGRLFNFSADGAPLFRATFFSLSVGAIGYQWHEALKALHKRALNFGLDELQIISLDELTRISKAAYILTFIVSVCAGIVFTEN